MSNPTISSLPPPATGPAAGEDHLWTEEELMAQVQPKIREALDAFRRDLPEMMKEHHREWVAYHGAIRLGFGKDDFDLYQRYMVQGYDPEELLVSPVEPEDTHWNI